MTAEYIPLDPIATGFYTGIINDLLNGKKESLELYPQFGEFVNWDSVIQSRLDFPAEIRKSLVKELLRQYGEDIHDSVRENVVKLAENNCFTITTGQQIHPGLGPMYVIYKIVTVLQKVEQLQKEYPHYQFVPVFWMASEDHDFEEINHFKLFGNEFAWETDQDGPVGRFSTAGLSDGFSLASEEFRRDEKVSRLLGWFASVYNEQRNLSSSTRFILNHFFGKYGLVVIEPDSRELKKWFAHAAEKELVNDAFNPLIMKQSEKLKALGYKPQIAPRSTNLFFIQGQRKRIDRKNQQFELTPGGDAITIDELQEQLHISPEAISPNVALRPLYQETILPNLAYVAGPAEAIYWLQLRLVFEEMGIDPPGLILRYSAIIADKKTKNNLEETGIEIQDLFLEEQLLKIKLINYLEKSNPMPGSQKLITENTELILSELYKNRNPRLKEIKKLADEYLKALNQVIRDGNEDFINQPMVQQKWNALVKTKSRFFNPVIPQERTVYFIEMLIQNPDLLEVLISIPVKEKHRFWTIWTK